MDSTEIVRQIQMVFEQLDTDNSGTLSIEELTNGLKMVDFGLGTNNEGLIQELFKDVRTDSAEITVEDFVQWNLKKISAFIVRGHEQSLAEVFLSPAFQVIDKLTQLKPLLPPDKGLDIDFCIDKIKSGKLYAAGPLSNTLTLSGSVKLDTLDIMMFFSEAVKRNGLKDDEVSTVKLSKHRVKSNTEFFVSEVQELTSSISLDSLDFDIFAVYETTNSVTRLLHAISDRCMKEWDLYSSLAIPYSNFMMFCYEISAGYREENPYHNNLHAGDVVQSLGYLLKHSDMLSVLELKSLHIMALIVAGLVHDYKHPGVTNSYLEHTKHHLAWRYNGLSILENYHVSEAFEVIKKSECNIFENLQPAEFRTARHIIVEAVLNTDMAKHSECLSKLHNEVMHEDTLSENKTLLLSFVLHAADVSHPARPWGLHETWTQMLQEEFFAQGDKEKALGISLIPLFDRGHTQHIPKMQIGFINGVILPYFKPLCKILGVDDTVIKNIERNRDKWAEFL